jgi:hypothetical protein
MAKKKSNMQNIINQINKDLDKIDIYKVHKSQTKEKLNKSVEVNKKEKDNSFLSFTSDNSMVKSNISQLSQTSKVTYISEPFNEEKDLDLPNFSSMKYASFKKRLSHSCTYMIYGLFLLISSFFWIGEIDDNKDEEQSNALMLVSHIFYFISTIIQWLYYRRGCIGESNYNSKVKTNIDKSLKARILRSEEGFKYFFSLFACVILIIGNIYYITMCDKPEPEYWNFNLIGCMIISLSQILKLEKILTQNKQYSVVNDLSHSLIEIFMFFGSLSFGAYYFIQIMYNYDRKSLKTLFITLKIGGNICIIFSGFCLLHRYFCSNFDDLNTSNLSNVTL